MNTVRDQRGRPSTEAGRSMVGILHDAVLTERVSSDLEQLKYAQILTSLALGPSYSSREGSEDDGEHSPGRTAELVLHGVDEIRAKIPRGRERRQVKPTKKIRELRERNELKSQRPPLRKTKTLGTVRDAGETLETVRDAGDTRENSTGRGEQPEESCRGDETTEAYGKTASEFKNESNADRRVRIVRSQSDGEKNARVPRRKTTAERDDSGNGKQPTFSESLADSPTAEAKSEYKCYQCGKCFKTCYTYSIHTRMPEHTEKAPFVCDICGKGFRLSSTLCRHKIIHTSNKPHQCKVCLKNFNRSSTLKMHMRTHSGRKQHVCAECGKGFHQKGNLRNHMFVHSGERPFMCESCGRHFNKKSNLKHHLKIHQLNGSLACTVCKLTFPRNDELQKHVESVHCKQQSRREISRIAKMAAS